MYLSTVSDESRKSITLVSVCSSIISHVMTFFFLTARFVSLLFFSVIFFFSYSFDFFFGVFCCCCFRLLSLPSCLTLSLIHSSSIISLRRLSKADFVFVFVFYCFVLFSCFFFLYHCVFTLYPPFLVSRGFHFFPAFSPFLLFLYLSAYFCPPNIFLA